jgi:serine/threonine protein phosphatase PrpC
MTRRLGLGDLDAAAKRHLRQGHDEVPAPAATPPLPPDELVDEPLDEVPLPSVGPLPPVLPEALRLPSDGFTPSAPIVDAGAKLEVTQRLSDAIAAIRETPLKEYADGDQQETLARADGALLRMVDLYRDGAIHPSQLGPLTRASLAISDVLPLKQTEAFERLDQPVQDRVQEQLFAPLEALSKLALKHADRGLNVTSDFDPMKDVLIKLDRPPIIYVPQPGETASSVMRAGGSAETDGIEVLATRFGRAAVFTHKGYEYAPSKAEDRFFNEDAVGTGQVGETTFITACDMAGGLGKLGDRDGVASEIAAQVVPEAAKRIEAGADPGEALRECAMEAHRTIVGLNEDFGTNALSTLAGVVLKNGVAHAVSCGDSQVIHMSKDGRIKNYTRPDNVMAKAVQLSREHGEFDPNALIRFAAQVTTGLGDMREDPEIHVDRWEDVEPGDYFITVTDGALDANLKAARLAHDYGEPWAEYHEDVTRRDFSALVRQSSSPEEVAKGIAGYAIRQAVAFEGKADNVSVAVWQVPDADAPEPLSG